MVRCPACNRPLPGGSLPDACPSCRAVLRPACPVCTNPVAMGPKVATICESCQEILRFCPGCRVLDRVDVLFCGERSCPNAKVPWTLAAAGGKDRWPMHGGGPSRGNRLHRVGLQEAHLSWMAERILEDVDVHGPVHANGILYLVTKSGTCLMYGEAGVASRDGSAPGPPARPLLLKSVSLSEGIEVTSPPVITDGLYAGLKNGSIVFVDPLTQEVRPVASLSSAVVDLLPVPDGWLIQTADRGVHLLDRDWKEYGGFEATALSSVVGSEGGGFEIGQVTLLPAVGEKDEVFVLYNVALARGTVACLLRLERQAFRCVGLIEGEIGSMLISAGMLMLFAEDGWYVVALRDLDPALSRGIRVALQVFAMPCVPARAPVLTSEDRLGCIGRLDGLLYRFQPASRGGTSRQAGPGARPHFTRPLAVGNHFLYACNDFVYFDDVPITAHLQGRAHPALSYANGRAFVATGHPVGLYAFEVT